MKKNYQLLVIIFVVVLLSTYIINSDLIIKSILEYTNIFITKLFPASFIIYILSSILIDYGIITYLSKLKLNGAISYIAIMSFISGFPSGAKYTKELLEKDLITIEEANFLITYTNFSNPIFLLGSISNVLTEKIAIKILVVTIISNFIIYLLFKVKSKKNIVTISTVGGDFSTSLKNGTIGAIKTLLIVYSTSLFFYLMSVIINKFIFLSPINYVIVNSFFDLTNGIFSTVLLSDVTMRTLLILNFLSFGSLSIHIQVKSIISDTDIKYKNYLLGRILQVLISIVIFLII